MPDGDSLLLVKLSLDPRIITPPPFGGDDDEKGYIFAMGTKRTGRQDKRL